ncbi:exo-beta-N-acetylmuramidase NamZ family protein [Orbus mooreae]|uniref:exo-beta-N-acetylmuramidase NamZ family protein n=1 Tax=Orbus mooreae TaxID=3074107 RepID=UPI00370D8FC1
MWLFLTKWRVLIALSLMLSLNCIATTPNLVLGVDRDSVYGPLLAGKNVALMVNQSSINEQGVHTIDKLLAEQQKYNFRIIKLFSVEHGLRGNEEAGFGDNDRVDVKTGLPIISLYGRDSHGRERANPTEEQLSNIDIVIYDLQDVGVRYFTYTVSMHYLLESLQKYQKELMIFDRPNPLGQYVYGPILKEPYISGIGIDPVPMVHGLTSGEFANMMVNEGWLTNFDHRSWQYHQQKSYQFPPDALFIIKMENYQQDMVYSLPIAPSPNLKTDLAISLYPSLGFFEATSVNSGRGSDYPFEQIGFSDPRFYVNATYSVSDTISKGGWPQAGKTVYGEKISTAESPTVKYFVDWWFKFQEHGYTLVVSPDEEKNYLTHQQCCFISRPQWLAKVTGDNKLLQQLLFATEQGLNRTQTISMIEQSWQLELADYYQLRDKYRLYP